MAIYASFQARGTQRVDVVSMGAISAPLPSLAPGQLFIASGPRTTLEALRPADGPARPKRVHAGVQRRPGPAMT